MGCLDKDVGGGVTRLLIIDDAPGKGSQYVLGAKPTRRT